MKNLIAAFGLGLAVTVLAGTTGFAAPLGPASSEAELVAVLRGDAPEADKAITCKYLAVKGSPAVVADLAPLLTNPRLASWARTCAMPCSPGATTSWALTT